MADPIIKVAALAKNANPGLKAGAPIVHVAALANKRGKKKKKDGGHSIGGFFGNAVSDVAKAAIGFGPGALHGIQAVGQDTAELVPHAGQAVAAIAGRHPHKDVSLYPRTAQLAQDVAKSYAQFYGPLAHGDIGKFGSNVYERPFQLPLDVLAVGTLGGAGAAKLIPRLGEPGEIALRTRTGEAVVKRTSRNPVTRGIQKGSRKATTTATGLVEKRLGREIPLGEHARAVGALEKRAARSQRAQTTRALRPFQQAVAPLKKNEKLAVVLSARAVKPSELRTLITTQMADARKAGDLGEVADHERMLKVIGSVDDDLVASVRTNPKLAKARQAASDLADAGGDILEGAGLLSKESRALRPYLTARVVRGARFSPEEGQIAGGLPIEQIKQDIGDAIYHPDIGPTPKLRETPTQGYAGRVPPRKPGSVRQSQAIRLLSSRWLPDPRAWSDAYLRVVGYAHAKERGQLALRIADPLDESGTARHGWFYVRAGAAKPGKAAAEREALGAELDKLLEEGVDHNFEGWLKDNVATPDKATAAKWEREGSEVRQISPADYKQIFGQFKGTNKLVKNFVDKPTNVWRTLTLTYRPAWLVNNLVGQTLLFALNHTAGGPAAYAKSVIDETRRSDRYFPEELRYGLFQAEQEFRTGPPRVRSAGNMLVRSERKLRDGINRVNSALSDNIPRRAAWYSIAKKERAWVNRVEGTNRTLDEFLNELRASVENPGSNSKLAQLHDEMAQQVLDELIDFGNMSDFERRVIRRVIPFYSWIKGITKATARLGLEHPAKMAIIYNLGLQGVNVSDLAFGSAADILQGDFPLGPRQGSEQRVIGTLGLNPLATVGQTVHAGQDLLSGSGRPGDNILFQMTPFYQAAVAALSRKDPFSGRDLSGGRLEILAKQLAQAPAPVRLAWALSHMPQGAKARRKLTKPDIIDLLSNYAGAPVRTKRVNVAKSLAHKRP